MKNSKEWENKMNAEYDAQFSLACEICNNPRPSLYDPKRCLTCGGKLFQNNVGIIKKTKDISVLARQIWNEAIEAAALRAERSFQHLTIAKSIRRLKK